MKFSIWQYMTPKSKVVIISTGVLLASYQNCSPVMFQPSMTEQKKLGDSPFEPRLTGVNDAGDGLLTNNGRAVASVQDIKWVKKCDSGRMEEERLLALAEAKNDPEKRTIPVKFSYSFGTDFDDTAYIAYERSILRKDSGGTTAIAIGPAKFSNGYADPAAAHYITDHTRARRHYIDGERCFFSTVKILEHRKYIQGVQSGRVKDSHEAQIIYYGQDSFDRNEREAKEFGLAQRLFKPLEATDYSKESPQIVQIFVADFREARFGVKEKILNVEEYENLQRGKQLYKSFREILNLKALFTHREAIDASLSKRATFPSTDGKKKYSFAGYEGVPQILHNLLNSGMTGTVMSTTYTPIVLDLGKPHIATTSLDWGTFFNLGNLAIKSKGGKERFKISHKTAWLGGPVINSGDGPEMNWQRRSEDGFLVIADENTKDLNAQNLFGTFTTVEGKSYRNGFEALQAFMKKDCASADPKDQYLGPWDGDLYTKALKVWVDANRNGVADAGELKSLVDHRVAALNTCFVRSEQDRDRHGNQTSLRSALLLMPKGEKIMGNDQRILQILESGYIDSSRKNEADFRVAIDIYFRADPESYLENVGLNDVQRP